MEKILRILILEDVPADAELVEHALGKARIVYTSQRVSSRGAFQKQLKEFSPDLILSDYSVPGFDGMAALRLTQEQAPETPFIIVTGSMNEETAVECMKAGANDYVIKQHLAHLGPAVKAALEKQRLRLAKEHADAKLRESEEMQRTVLNNIDEVIYTVKMNETNLMAGTVEFVSGRAVEESFGHAPDDFKNNPNLWFSLLHPDDQEQVYKQTMEICTTRRTGTRVYRMKAKKNGHYHWVEDRIVPQVDDKGKLIGIFGVARDITERKQVEDELRRLSTAVRESANSLLITNKDGVIEYVNPAFEKITGYSRQEVIGHTPRILKSGKHDDQFYKTFWQRILAGEVVQILFINKKKNGELYYQDEVISPIIDPRGNITDFISTGHEITQRVLAEKALQESEERYRNLVENISDVFYVSNAQGKLVYGSPNLFTGTGYEPQEILGKIYVRLIAPEDRRRIVDFYLEQIRTGVLDAKCEFKGLCKNGNIVWVEQITRFVRDSDGNVTECRNVVRNITERKETEQKIRLLAHALKGIGECVSITDTEDRILFVNDAFLKAYGYEEHELLAKHISAVRSANNQPEIVREILPATMRGGWSGELWNRRKDGSEFQISLSTSVVKDEQGQIVALIGVARDITERKLAEEASKRAEQALKQSEEHYRTFFEDDLTGDYVSTPDGRILACNPAFVHIFGFASIEEALNTNASTLVANPEERERFLSLLREKKRLEYYKTEYIRRDGKRVYSVENAIGIFDAQGDLVQIRGYLFDDTKGKLLEQQLLQAQKLESLGTLAGGIAHDFNNILGIILGHSALLERFKEDPQKLSESIESITKATQRGASLVKQLLTFARKTEALFEIVSINDMIREIDKLLKETFPKTITVSMSLQQDLPAIVADASQIHQLLLNLCMNARDAMPKRGTLSISTRTIEGEAVRLRFAKATGYPVARQYVQIEVADTGIGMDEATRQRIFEPFFTTKALGKGTGLGLAVVFGIVGHHNGFIDVRSAPGEGTSFTVYLPIPEHAPEVSQRARKGLEEVPGGTETILVIEDEEMLMELVKAVLVSKGYTVLIAEDGMQGVEMYQSHQKEIAVVLSDVGLPVLSGQDVFKRIREINPKAKVIMASGFMDPEAKSEMYKAGLKNFIQKPYLADEVLQKIREVIDSNG